MGKWTKLAESGTYANQPGDPTRADAVNAELDKLKDKTTAELADLYNAADKRKKDAAAEEKAANFDLEVLTKALDRNLKNTGLDSVVTNGYRYTPTPEPYATVSDKAAFLAWAHEHMRDNLDIAWATLNAVVKSDLESGAELPPGVDVYIKRGIHRTKQKE